MPVNACDFQQNELRALVIVQANQFAMWIDSQRTNTSPLAVDVVYLPNQHINLNYKLNIDSNHYFCSTAFRHFKQWTETTQYAQRCQNGILIGWILIVQQYQDISDQKMKFAQQFLRTLTKVNIAPLITKRQITPKVALTTLGLGFATWLSTTKYFNEELTILETEDNLQDGEVRELLVGPKPEDTILVINYQGKIYSIQSKCSHFGFSLAKGLLVGDEILCPLHNAGFSISTGQPNQGPSFNGLKTFAVERVDGKIRVSVPKQGWSSAPEYKEIGKDNINKNQKIVIIGGGTAGLSAAETLRKTGYKGYIYLITREKDIPYDRSLLSKAIGGPGPKPIRSEESLENNGIIVLKQSNVTDIDYNNKSVLIQNKEPISYDKLLIASGAKNRVPNIQGLNEVKYYSLRNKEDYLNITEALKASANKNVTIIGGGFIGMEIASAIKLAHKEANVTVLQANSVPLEGVIGSQLGKVLQKLSEKNGVKVVTNARIKNVQASGQSNSINLDGSSVPTDVLIVATGVQASTPFAKGLETAEGGIKTNVFLETSQKDVYAAGDVAAYPYWYTGNHTRIEHYNQAIYQGSVAALNMAGKKFPVDNIPFFWTRQFNNSLVFTGVTKGWDDIHIVGDLAEMKFVAYYIRKSDDKVLGAAAMNQLNKIQIINEAMRNGVMPNASTIKNQGFQLEQLLKEIKKKDPKCSKCTACQ